MTEMTVNRRDLLAHAGALGFTGMLPAIAKAQEEMPRRMIPGTSESLPVIGLGSSKVVQEIAANGTAPLAGVLRSLVANGGSVVDTWPRNADNDAAFGRVIAEPDLRDSLFVTTKVDQRGKAAGIAQFEQTLQLYGRDPIDLVQVFSLTDLEANWPSLRDFKEDGRARYIGVTVSEGRLYPALEDFLANETPDFVQVNFSITERESEDRLLPMLADRGIGVIINRPFMNGTYFRRLEAEPLPEWVAEFDCTSWAQFSLKYILANRNLTCVLTETSNPEHMHENAQTAFGRLPDEDHRRRMRALIDAL